MRSSGFEWAPLLHGAALKKSKSEHHWVVGVTDSQLMCVICKGDDKYPATLPRPVTAAPHHRATTATTAAADADDVADATTTRRTTRTTRTTTTATTTPRATLAGAHGAATPQQQREQQQQQQQPPQQQQNSQVLTALPLAVPLACAEPADPAIEGRRLMTMVNMDEFRVSAAEEGLAEAEETQARGVCQFMRARPRVCFCWGGEGDGEMTTSRDEVLIFKD